MAFDEQLADRVRAELADCPGVSERRMFGGLTFMVNGHMCCGVNGEELIVRLTPDDEEAAMATAHARPMDFTNRPMAGFVTFAPAGLDDAELTRWIAAAVDHATSLPPKTPRKPQSRR